MKDNSFEKQIAEKLNRMEVRVPDSLLDSIMEKRAARQKKFTGFGALVTVVSVAVLGLIGITLYMQEFSSDDNKSSGALQENVSTPEGGSQNSSEQADNNGSDNSGEAQNALAQADQSENAKDAVTPKRTFRRSGRMQSDAVTASAIGESASRIRLAKNRTSSIRTAQPTKAQLAAIAGFTADDYFNTASTLRPEIAFEQHKGNSHLYVYEAFAGDPGMSTLMLFSRPARMNRFLRSYTFEALSPVSAKSKTQSTKNIGKRPVFVDVLFMPAWNMHSSASGNEIARISDGLSVASFNNQFGFRISVPLQNAFSVFGGVNYKAQSNRYKGEIQYSENETRIDKHVSYINDPVKGVIQVVRYDTVQYMADRTQHVDHKNTYTLLQLPVGVSYNFGYKGIDFAVHGSALFNAFIQSSGQALHIETHSTTAFSSSKPFFGLGAGIGFMAAARLTPRFRLIAEPGFQYYGIHSTRAGNTIGEKALNASFSVGLRYTVF